MPWPLVKFLLPLLGTVGLWLMDVGQVYQMTPALGDPGNGFFSLAADKVYHIGLYLTLASLWVVAWFGVKKG